GSSLAGGRDAAAGTPRFHWEGLRGCRVAVSPGPPLPYKRRVPSTGASRCYLRLFGNQRRHRAVLGSEIQACDALNVGRLYGLDLLVGGEELAIVALEDFVRTQ